VREPGAAFIQAALDDVMALVAAAALGMELVEEAARDSSLAVLPSWHDRRARLRQMMEPYLSPTFPPSWATEATS
jgi:hypothetical protein